MEFIESNNLVESPKYFVISDDIPLVKTELGAYSDIEYIENKTSLEMLYILSHCKNYIMTVSSFSWWGGYLNKYSNLTIIPCHYYNLFKENHLTYKIQFKVDKKNKCTGAYKEAGYIMQYKDRGQRIEKY